MIVIVIFAIAMIVTYSLLMYFSERDMRKDKEFYDNFINGRFDKL